MKHKAIHTKAFEKDIKRCRKRGCEMSHLLVVRKYLLEGENLPPQYKDHKLKGEFEDSRECHIKPDWLLVYRVMENEKEVIFERTGSHSDLFD